MHELVIEKHLFLQLVEYLQFQLSNVINLKRTRVFVAFCKAYINDT